MIAEILSYEIGGVTLGEMLTVDFLATILGNVLAAILILVAGFMVGAWLKRRIRALGAKYEQLDITLFNFLGNIVRYAVLVFAGLFVLNTFGIQTTSFVALIGAAGLAIGLALQGTLSNVAAGVMIVFFRPINVGNFVEVGGKMGTVKDITLNFVELASIDNVQIIIPNSQVWGNVITNFSGYDTRQVEWVFGVGYGADLAKAEAILRDTIMRDTRAHPFPEPLVQVTILGASSVDFSVRVWCDAANFWGFKTDMTRAVKEAFDAGGIDIPFPTRTVVNVAG